MDLIAVRQISGKARLVMITILLTILLTLAPALPETRTVEAVSLQEDQADAVLSHLQAVLEDLAFMEELLSDQQLGLFAGSDDDSELTAWQMQDMAELARQHRQKVDQALLAADNRQAPE